MKNKNITIQDIFHIACEGEESPTLTAGQIYAEIARKQFSPEAIKECRRLAELAVERSGSYSDILQHVQMILIGLSDMADDEVSGTISKDRIEMTDSRKKEWHDAECLVKPATRKTQGG